MNDQDRDLIIALAQGHLSTDAAEEANARIEGDPELASAYAEQILALDHLSSLAAPQMSVDERSGLHANLTEQLGLVRVADTPPAPAKRKATWWAPVFGLATAAAVVAAVVILPGSADDSFDDVSAGANLDTAVTSTAASAAEAAPADEEQGLVDEGELSVYATGSVELEDLLEEADGAGSPQAVERQLADLNFKSTVDLDTDQVQACLNELSTDLPDEIVEILVLGADVDDESTVVHLGFDFGSGVEDGLSFVLGDCSLVDHAPQG
jgi:anti-sigma-K factor RskA